MKYLLSHPGAASWVARMVALLLQSTAVMPPGHAWGEPIREAVDDHWLDATE